MFEIGFWELIMVGVVALIVVGPEQLPGLARKAGFWLGKARRMIDEIKADVDRELHFEELKQTLRQQADLSEVQDVAEQMKSLRREVEEEFDDPGPPPDWQPGMSAAPPPPGWQPGMSAAPPPGWQPGMPTVPPPGWTPPDAPQVPPQPESTPVSLQKPPPVVSPASPPPTTN
mgnify:CR=1 FL=1